MPVNLAVYVMAMQAAYRLVHAEKKFIPALLSIFSAPSGRHAYRVDRKNSLLFKNAASIYFLARQVYRMLRDI